MGHILSHPVSGHMNRVEEEGVGGADGAHFCLAGVSGVLLGCCQVTNKNLQRMGDARGRIGVGES